MRFDCTLRCLKNERRRETFCACAERMKSILGRFFVGVSLWRRNPKVIRCVTPAWPPWLLLCRAGGTSATEPGGTESSGLATAERRWADPEHVEEAPPQPGSVHVDGAET